MLGKIDFFFFSLHRCIVFVRLGIYYNYVLNIWNLENKIKNESIVFSLDKSRHNQKQNLCASLIFSNRYLHENLL